MTRLGRKFKTIQEVEQFYQTPVKKSTCTLTNHGNFPYSFKPVSPERMKDFYTFLGVPKNENGKYYTFTNAEFKKAALQMLKTATLKDFDGVYTNYNALIKKRAKEYLLNIIYNLAGQGKPKEANIRFVTKDQKGLDMNPLTYDKVERIANNLTEKEIKDALYEGIMKTENMGGEIDDLEKNLPKLENDFLSTNSAEVTQYINEGMKKRSPEDFEMVDETMDSFRNMLYNLSAIHQKNQSHGFFWRLWNRSKYRKDLALERKVENTLRKYGMNNLINQAKTSPDLLRDSEIEDAYRIFVEKSCDEYKKNYDLEQKRIAEEKTVMNRIKDDTKNALETINKKNNNLPDITPEYIKTFYEKLGVVDMSKAKEHSFTTEEFISAGLKTLSTVKYDYFEGHYSDLYDMVDGGSKSFLQNLLRAVCGSGDNLENANTGMVVLGENKQIEFFNASLFNETSDAINKVPYEQLLETLKNGVLSNLNLSQRIDKWDKKLPILKNGVLSTENLIMKDWVKDGDMDEDVYSKDDVQLLTNAVYDLKVMADRYRQSKSPEYLHTVQNMKQKLTGYGFESLLNRITDDKNPITIDELDNEIKGKKVIDIAYRNLIYKSKSEYFFTSKHLNGLLFKLKKSLPNINLNLLENESPEMKFWIENGMNLDEKFEGNKDATDAIYKALVTIKEMKDHFKNDAGIKVWTKTFKGYGNDQLIDDILDGKIDLFELINSKKLVEENYAKFVQEKRKEYVEKVRDDDAIQLRNRIKSVDGFLEGVDVANDYFSQKKDELKVFAGSKMDITDNNLYETQFEKFTFTVKKMAQTLSMFANISQERIKSNVIGNKGKIDILYGVEDDEISDYIHNLKSTMIEKGFSNDLVDELATGKYDEAKIRDFVENSILEIQNDKNCPLAKKWTTGDYDIGEKGLNDGVEKIKLARQIENEFSEEQKKENDPKKHIDKESLKTSNHEIVGEIDFIDEFDDNEKERLKNKGEEVVNGSKEHENAKEELDINTGGPHQNI